MENPMNHAFAPCLALPLLLCLAPKPGHAQATTGPFTDVPKTDRAYQDLAVLHTAGITGDASDYFGSRAGQATRYNFASLAASILDTLSGGSKDDFALPDAATVQTRLLQHPSAVAALTDLVNEFQSEEMQIGVDLSAAHLRLATLLQGHAPPISPPFSDVPKNHWAYQSVETVRKAGIVTGEPDGRFHGGGQRGPDTAGMK